MFIFGLLVRATALVIAGYFVWFAASRSDEKMKQIGKYLAMWTFVVAILYVFGSLAMPYMRGNGPMGRGHFGPVAMRMHRGMMGPGMGMNRGFGMHRFMHRDGNPSTEQNPANPQAAPATQPATPTPAPSK